MRDDHKGDRKDAHAKLWSMIKGIRVAMLTSWDGHRMHTRPMHGHQEEFSGELWFFTKLDLGKTHEVMRFDQVNLAYADIGSNTYVSVAGKAEVVLDRELVKRFWNSARQRLVPEGSGRPGPGADQGDGRGGGVLGLDLEQHALLLGGGDRQPDRPGAAGGREQAARPRAAARRRVRRPAI